MTTLSDLFIKYGTDKDRNGYTEMYAGLLDPIRYSRAHILEIGIGTLIPTAPSSMSLFHGPGYAPGGSLRAFRDYCPRADILGLDIQPDTQFSEERISTGLCNSIDSLAVALFFSDRVRTFDLVIDDGLHTAYGQIATLVNFHDKVCVGGHYVIEDIFDESPVFETWRAITGPRFELVHKRINAIALRRVR